MCGSSIFLISNLCLCYCITFVYIPLLKPTLLPMAYECTCSLCTKLKSQCHNLTTITTRLQQLVAAMVNLLCSPCKSTTLKQALWTRGLLVINPGFAALICGLSRFIFTPCIIYNTCFNIDHMLGIGCLLVGHLLVMGWLWAGHWLAMGWLGYGQAMDWL